LNPGTGFPCLSKVTHPENARFVQVKRLIGKGFDRVFQLDERELEEVRRRAAENRSNGRQT
jgi:hypothetical protein